LDGLTLKGFIEFTAGLDGCSCHVPVLSLFTQFAARQFEAASLAKVFELPEGAPQIFPVVSPFKDQAVEVTSLRAGEAAKFKLQPFEVLVVEALP
jgi:hypothetical protein